MSLAEQLARSIGSVEVIPWTHAERGHPRLVPDPRELLGWPLLATQAGRQAQTRPSGPRRLVIVVHSDDLDGLISGQSDEG